MVITAKFASTCPKCGSPISEGTKVNWERGQKATHVNCPAEATTANMALDNGQVDLLCAIVNGDAQGNVAAAQAALDLIEDRLFTEYDKLQYAEGRTARAEMVAEENGTAADLPKGIYRVSLTGQEKRYGVDHVNVQVVPNAKYQNVKVGEWHGEGLGTYSASRGFRYWPSVDPTGARTLAVRAAFDVLLGSADPVEYAKAYAKESQTCWRCGADLVDETSRERLMGPDCYRMQFGKGG